VHCSGVISASSRRRASSGLLPAAVCGCATRTPHHSSTAPGRAAPPRLAGRARPRYVRRTVHRRIGADTSSAIRATPSTQAARSLKCTAGVPARRHPTPSIHPSTPSSEGRRSRREPLPLRCCTATACTAEHSACERCRSLAQCGVCCVEFRGIWWRGRLHAETRSGMTAPATAPKPKARQPAAAARAAPVRLARGSIAHGPWRTRGVKLPMIREGLAFGGDAKGACYAGYDPLGFGAAFARGGGAAVRSAVCARAARA
jgi:hypothetical protein